MRREETPVLIVGGGPVGLALSIDLSWRGIRHVLVDRDDRAMRAMHPRMDQVGIRSMEHFRRLGIAAEVEAAGFPRDMRRDVVFATGVLGHELAREPFEADATRPTPSFSPQKHELCPQNFLDPVLQRVAERGFPSDIRHRTRLVDLRDDDGCVRCDLMDDVTNRCYGIDAGYVAGCDGSGGIVANRLGVGSSGRTTLACSTNLFIHAPMLRGAISGPGAYRYILIGPEGVWASMVNIDGRNTWRLQVLGDAERPNWTDPEARAIINRAIGRDIPYTLESVVPWIRREMISDQFRVGRCFLLGDAAHQFSPTGGYGMNTGLSEAFNLSWKLAAMLDGWGGPDLLSSYEAERRPVAVRNAQRATLNFQLMRRTQGSALLMVDTAEGEAVRAATGREMRESMSEEWDSMGIHLGYSYAGSPIVCNDGTPGDSHPAHYRQSARPGDRAPHAWIGEGRSMLDLFGRSLVLLQFDRDADADANRLLAEADRQAVPLRREFIGDADVARLYERRLVLVRQDGHVAMRCDDLPCDVEAIIARIRGASPPRAAHERVSTANVAS